MHTQDIATAGKKLGEAQKALVLLHGRGARAQDILSLGRHLNVRNYALIAPQATNHTWYPYSFMAKQEDNEPWLSSALDVVEACVEEIKAAGITTQNIYFLGFSQGACLTLEFVTRNAQKWGGVVAFTGGLIGEVIHKEHYKGDFGGAPFFISTGNPDPHVPVERVKESARIIGDMHGAVRVQIYENRPHTITPDELEKVNSFLFK